MRTLFGGLALLFGVSACGSRSEEASQETTRVATDTIVETRQVVDTLLVQTDTAVTADTTIVVDTTISADTTIMSDTTRLDGGVIEADTVPAE